MSEAADIAALAAETLALNRAMGRRAVTAESCTGGLVAAALTAIAGSSDVMEAGFVTYSNAAKARMLGVDPAIFDRNGAVSPECARAMAAGALANSDGDVAVAITGVAGPGGGSADKPVGLVVFARAIRINKDAAPSPARHAEPVSASMASGGELAPWTLKQVQGDESAFIVAHHVQRIFFQSKDRAAIRAAAQRHALMLLQPAADTLGAEPDADVAVP
jgi:nicotinamide-nucleotide amidase